VLCVKFYWHIAKWEVDHKEVEMPNRVDANTNVARPTFGQDEARQANRASQEARPEPQPPQTDRVEISAQARRQAEQAQPRAGEGNASGAAAEAPSARPEAGEQGVNQATVQQAEQLRDTREENVAQSAQEPQERQGNLVDVVG
jgi:hypothetical protein